MTTEAELAGNYVTSGGSGDPAFVAEKLAAMQDEAAERQVNAASHEATRRAIETTADDDVQWPTVEITIPGLDPETGEAIETTHEVPITGDLQAELPAGTDQLFREGSLAGHMDVELVEERLYAALVECSGDEYDLQFWMSAPSREIGRFVKTAVENRAGN